MRIVLFYLLILFCVTASVAQRNTLDYFINEGLQRSPLLKDYQYQVQTNKIDSQLLRASFGPQVSGNGASLYAPVIKGFGYDGAITNVRNFSALAGFSKVLIGRENLNNRYQVIQLLNLGLQNQGKITEQDLRRNIVQQYITAYGDILQIRFNQDMLTLFKTEQDLLKRLTERGVYKQTDYLSFLVNVQQQEMAIRQLTLQYRNDYNTLNYISGIADTSYSELTDPGIVPPLIPGFEETVFYRQYEIDSLKIITNDRQIDYNYKPKVNLVADGGYNSSFIATPYKNFGISGGINLTVPIYDGKQRRLQHQKNVIAEQSRKTNLDFFSNQFRQQLDQLQQQLRLTQQLIDQTIPQITFTETLVKAQRQQMITGDVRITDYIIAIGNYLNAKNLNTQNTINKLQIINQIDYWNRKP